MFAKCKQLHPDFEVWKTLMGIVVDWSDADLGGLLHYEGKIQLKGKILTIKKPYHNQKIWH